MSTRAGQFPDIVEVVVEIPRGSRNKHEFDETDREMRDDKGADFKILCVCVDDLHHARVERLDQVRPHRLVEIEHFFETYKTLEDKAVEVVGWRDERRAREVLLADRATREVELLAHRAPA